MAIYEFKQMEHNLRQQLLEDSFSKGMQFTKTPMMEGWANVIANYDLQDSGNALKPRAGLQTFQVYTSETLGSKTIVAAREQNISSTQKCAQILTIEPVTVEGMTDTYNLCVVTGGITPIIPEVAVPGTTFYNYKVSDPIVVQCVLPHNAEIHGITIENTVLARHPGVYGWTERYYFFDVITNKMVHTEWDPITSAFKFVSDSPKETTAKEAVSYGYNMFQANPYTFANSAGAVGSVIEFQGIMPYDTAGNLCLTPVQNQSLTFETFYQVPLNAKYHIIFEWRSAVDSGWELIKEFDTTFTEVGYIKIPFSPPEDNLIIRVSAYGYTGDVRNTYTDATLAVGFNFAKNQYGSVANTTPKIYSVAKATGVTYWKNRMIVWGVPEDQTILFSSDINDPTYFPYPNNCDPFDEPIKFAAPFLDNLLVYTSTKLYQLTLSVDGLSWTKKCIQSNLTINDWDIHLIQVVKNMVFFRSGNYFYMMVPKSGAGMGELTLAAVSKPLYYFFDHFDSNVKKVIEDMYGYTGNLTLKHYYNYLDFEDIHNVYVFQTDQNEMLNLEMLYNTVDRTWRFYILGSQEILVPYQRNMTQKGILCTANTFINETAEPFVVYQFLQYNNVDNADSYYMHTNALTAEQAFDAVHFWHNWQHLDTGYREHQSNFKKRYRELQFVINNRSNKTLKFYTDFFIDGEQRRNRYTYQVLHNIDPDSPRFGEITMEKILGNPLIATGATALGENTTDNEAWELDYSMFPDTSFWKARFLVSGKGYTPRMILTSRNELPYELLNISWVYHSLNSR